MPQEPRGPQGPTTDTFYDELVSERHAHFWFVEPGPKARARRVRPFDNANRDIVRRYADEGCAECRALVEAFDAAFAHHFLFGD